MPRHLDGISVVICTHKGDEVLPACLEAIRNQNWNGKLEVIVVNDDPTSDLVLDETTSPPFLVLNNKSNLGPAGARNLGIQNAKFNLIAFTDDDCRPEPQWLSELAKAIQSNDYAVAAGGKTLPFSTSSTLFGYLALNNPLQPLELKFSQRRTSLARLISYLRSLVFTNSHSNSEKIRSVYALPSANLAVRIEALQHLGMFDETIRFSGEDQDLCRRLNLEYEDGLIYTPNAIVYHQYKNSLSDTLRRSKAYALGNFVLKLKWPEIGLVVFPVPVIWVVTSVSMLAFFTNFFWLPTVLLPLCYPRYLLFALRSRTLQPLLYFAINFLQDWWANFGLIQAIFTRIFHPEDKFPEAKNSS